MDHNPWEIASKPHNSIPLNINRSDLPSERDIYADQPRKKTSAEIFVDIENTLKKVGLNVVGGILNDGQIHRISDISKPGDKTSGWYVVNEVLGGVFFCNFGSWISGYKGEYSSIDHRSFTDEQEASFEKLKIESQIKHQEEQKKRWTGATMTAQTMFNDGKKVIDFQYLTNKKLPGNVKVSQSNDYCGWMMVPVFDENNTISTIQFIDKNGDKRFLSGGRKKGCCHMISGNDSEIYLVEGYATGLTVAEATGSMVAVAFDAGNLEAVGIAITKKYGNSDIVIAGDNDHEKDNNAGRKAAEKVARRIGARVEFPPSINGVSDFNDLYIEQGIEAVKEIFESSLEKLFSARPVRVSDFENISPRQFLSGTHLIRGFVSATVAPPGVGKSTLSMQEAIGPKRRLKVLLINLEDSLDELRIRVAGICTHYSIELCELEGWLFLNSGRNHKLKIAEYAERGRVSINPVVEAIKATIIKNQIDILIVDPFVRSHYVDENSNKDIDLVMEQFTRIAEETNCAIDLVHHTSKPSAGHRNFSADANQARGASAFIGAVRSARILSEMNSSEATNLDIEKDERRWFVRVDNVKSNLTAPSSGGDWYKRTSVQTDYLDQEKLPVEIGVFEEWFPPNKSVIFFSPDQLIEIKDIVQKGLPNGDLYSGHPQARNRWLGLAIAKMFNKNTETDRRYLTNVIANLFECKIIETVEIKTTGRDKGKGLVVVEPVITESPTV